jgi:hypothetical protein
MTNRTKPAQNTRKAPFPPRSYPNRWLDTLRARKAARDATAALPDSTISTLLRQPDCPRVLHVLMSDHAPWLGLILYVLFVLDFRVVGYTSAHDPLRPHTPRVRATVLKRLRVWHPLSWPIAILCYLSAPRGVTPRRAAQHLFAGTTHLIHL